MVDGDRTGGNEHKKNVVKNSLFGKRKTGYNCKPDDPEQHQDCEQFILYVNGITDDPQAVKYDDTPKHEVTKEP